MIEVTGFSLPHCLMSLTHFSCVIFAFHPSLWLSFCLFLKQRFKTCEFIGAGEMLILDCSSLKSGFVVCLIQLSSIFFFFGVLHIGLMGSDWSRSVLLHLC